MKRAANSAETVLKDMFGDEAVSVLPAYLSAARWFRSKDEAISGVGIEDVFPFADEGRKPLSALVIARVSYAGDGRDSDLYLLDLQKTAYEAGKNAPEPHICEFEDGGKRYIVHGAFSCPAFSSNLMEMMLDEKSVKGCHGTLVPSRHTRQGSGDIPAPELNSIDQSNSSVTFGTHSFMKIFRRLDYGTNPEIEIGAHFAGGYPFKNAPRIIGSLAYVRDGRECSLASAHEYVKSKGSAWDYFMDCLPPVVERALKADGAPFVYDREQSIFGPAGDRVLPEDQAGELMKMLGKRTAEMHRALGMDAGDTNFVPGDFGPEAREGLYNSISIREERVRNGLRTLPEGWEKIRRHVGALRSENFGGHLIRIHGDYHLGQVLFTGNDFIILDFEGEPLRPIEERRKKKLPLQDVAGMLRSIDYLIHYYLKENLASEADRKKAGSHLRLWRLRMCRMFAGGYMEAADKALLPVSDKKIRLLTEILMLEKAFYEIEYELSARPDWVSIPLGGLADLIPTLSNPDEARAE